MSSAKALHHQLMEAASSERGEVELRTLIRRVEKPGEPTEVSDIWVAGFSAGYDKAWATMTPYMLKGLEKAQQTAHDQGMMEAVRNLEPVIEKRLLESGQVELRRSNELLAKRDELKRKLEGSTDEGKREMYQHYLDLLAWVILRAS